MSKRPTLLAALIGKVCHICQKQVNGYAEFADYESGVGQHMLLFNSLLVEAVAIELNICHAMWELVHSAKLVSFAAFPKKCD